MGIEINRRSCPLTDRKKGKEEEERERESRGEEE